jgi:hypothetical protein
MIPYHSHVVPKVNHHLPKDDFKADLRAETTALGLLLWTYADERVRAASEQGLNDMLGPREPSSTVLGRLGDSVEGTGRGVINGRLEPHEDALAVDSLVRAWFDQDGVRHAYMAWYLEKRMGLPRASDLEPLHCVPKLDERGRLEVLYPLSGRHEPYLCLLEWKGCSAARLAFVQEMHDLFHGLLGVLSGVKLSKWKVVSGV